MSDAWNPARYERFAAERRQPFIDLVDLVEPIPGGRAVDLGCGTGAMTAQLPELTGATEVLGLDTSAAMLAEAVVHAGPHVRFARGDLGTFDEPGQWDLVLSNAALHWVPDHASVLARWAAALRPGGQLAVQVPANADHPSQQVATELAATEPFRAALGGDPPVDVVAANVERPERYAELLDGLGFDPVHVRLQVYVHHLAAPADVVEWVRGASLTRFEARLEPPVYEAFLEAYRERLLPRLGDRRPYPYLFKRVLLWGRR